MALLHVHLKSQVLSRYVPVEVVLPIDRTYPPDVPPRGDEPFKTLYLLHGLHGDSMSWLTGSRIRFQAEERNLAVVMPAGENGFYVDLPDGHHRYGEFIGRELVELTRRMFPLSHQREDTFIAGLSMGGFGALRNGLRYPETFGHIAGLSNALILEHAQTTTHGAADLTRDRAYFESCFGNLDDAIHSDVNPEYLASKLAGARDAGREVRIPNIYLACGTEDELITVNRNFRDVLAANGIDCTYEEWPGAHNWDFWNASIARVLDWLPLEGTESS